MSNRLPGTMQYLAAVSGGLITLAIGWVNGGTLDPWWILVGFVVGLGIFLAFDLFKPKQALNGHHDILSPAPPTRHPALLSPASFPPAQMSTSPSTHPLPSLPPQVIRRYAELDDMGSRYAVSHALVLHGKGGQGKTTFASLFVNRWHGQHLNCFYWYDAAEGRRTGGEIISAALSQMSQPTERNTNHADELAARLCDALHANPGWLIVVGGFDESDIDSEGKLRDPELAHLLNLACNGLDQSRLLITARNPVNTDNYRPPAYYPLDPFEKKEGAKLLSSLLARNPKPDPADLEKAAGKGFAEGYPFALTVLAKLLNGCPGDTTPVAYLQYLFTQPAIWYDHKEATGLLNEIWASLPPEQQQMLAYVATFDRPIPATIIKGMLDHLVPPQPFDHTNLDALDNRDLLIVVDGTDYTMHPMIRQFVRNPARNSHVADHHRAAASYFQQAYRRSHPDAHTHPARDLADVQPLLDGFDQLYAASSYQMAFDLLFDDVEQLEQSACLLEKLDQWAAHGQLIRMLESLNTPDANQALGAENSRLVLSNLGTAYLAAGEYRRAITYLSQAFDMARQQGNVESMGNAAGNLFTAYRRVGDYPSSTNYLTQFLKFVDASNDPKQKIHGLVYLGDYFYSLEGEGAARQAAQFYEQALNLTSEIELRCHLLGNLGVVYDAIGDVTNDYSKAINYNQQAQELAHEHKLLDIECRSWANLGVTYRKVNKPREAVESLSKALDIAEEKNNPAWQSGPWNTLGLVYEQQGISAEALACYFKSRDFYRITGEIEIELVKGNISDLKAAHVDQWPTLEVEAKRFAAIPKWRPPDL